MNSSDLFDSSHNMSGLAYVLSAYRHAIETKSDPRTANWWFMSSPAPLVTILASYLYFCISAGPRYMKDKKPYQLKEVLLIYNALQVAFSIFLVHEGLLSGWLYDYNYTCQPVDYSNDPKALRMASVVWWYFFCKIIELLDTVFFVLRKKMNQVSFLHLYHHTMMPICGWIGVRFLPGGHGTLLGLINSFIHIIMYSYYLVAGLGPQYQKYLWWKRYLTTMQMIQFCIIFVHSSLVLFQPSCNYPKFISFLLATQALVFLYMFASFYVRTYLKKSSSKNSNTQHQTTETVTSNELQQNGHVPQQKTEKVQ